MNTLIVTIYKDHQDAPSEVKMVLQCEDITFLRDIKHSWNRGILQYCLIHPSTGEELHLMYTLEFDEWFTVSR